MEKLLTPALLAEQPLTIRVTPEYDWATQTLRVPQASEGVVAQPLMTLSDTRTIPDSPNYPEDSDKDDDF